MAVAQTAWLRRAPRPAETLGPLLVAGTQLLAGIALALVAVGLGVVAQAQLQRIDTDFISQLVHRALQRIDANGRPRGAHIQRGIDVQRCQTVAEAHVVAGVEHAGPLHLVFGEVLEARGLADGPVLDGLQPPVTIGRQLELLDGAWAIAEGEHLLAGQLDAHRGLELERGHYCQRQLVLRAQAGAEGTADEGRQHADLALHVEHLLQVALAVLHALGLVVDQQLPARLVLDDGSMRLHGVVVFHRGLVLTVDAICRRRERRVEITTRLGELGRRIVGLIAHGLQIGLVCLDFVFDSHQARRMARQGLGLGHHQRQRLAAVEHSVVVQRAERRAFGGIVVLVGLVVAGHRRSVLMGQHQAHAGQCLGRGGVDARDSATGDAARDHRAVEQPRHLGFGGIAGLAGDLERAVDAVQRLAEWRVGAVHRTVPPAASVSARTMARWARSILKALSASGCAPCSRRSAAAANLAGSAR